MSWSVEVADGRNAVVPGLWREDVTGCAAEPRVDGRPGKLPGGARRMSRMATVVALLGLIINASTGSVWAQEVGLDQERHRATDPVSGAEVTIYRSPGGNAAFEVADRGVSVRKAMRENATATMVETTIETPTEHLTMRLTQQGLQITTAEGLMTARPGDREAAEAVTQLLAGSQAVGRALDLLRRVSHHTSSPVAHAVFSTRLMLMTVSGEVEAARALGRSLVESTPARIVRASAAQGPGDCWDRYAQEAIEAYMEYEDCVDNEQWWDVAGLALCLGIYEMRAIGAFSWWLSCVSIRG